MRPMKRARHDRHLAPTPRLTLWVPALIALALILFWLGLLALIRL